MSTQTMVLVRSVARGVWRTAFLLFLMILLWALLQRGGLIEKSLEVSWRWQLEKYRVFIGPVLLIPVLFSSLGPFIRCRRSPHLPGKKILFAVLLMGGLILGVLGPVQTRNQQMEDERRCRDVYLPLAYQLWKDDQLPESLPACPVQWESSLGNYLVIDREDFVIVDRYHWHPEGAWGVTPQGDVKKID